MAVYLIHVRAGGNQKWHASYAAVLIFLIDLFWIGAYETWGLRLKQAPFIRFFVMVNNEF